MLSREGKQTDRGAVGAEFIGYNRRRREALLLQEFPHQPNCRPSVPAGLNQEIQDFALTVHGTPEIELPPSNYDDHLVQVPAFGRSWPPILNPPRIGPTEFQDPSSNCLIRDVETTLGKQVLNVPIAQRETAIEPDGMLDDDRWKAVTTVGYLAHPETLKHRPCRSHAVNVTMPAPVLEAAKHALDDVGLPVDGLVIMVLDLAVLARWDDGRGSAFCQPVAQGFAVIALVGNEFGGGRHGFDTALGDLAIMDVSWCQEQDEGPAFRIADSVELGVAAPLGAADAMGQGPPFPPPAQR